MFSVSKKDFHHCQPKGDVFPITHVHLLVGVVLAYTCFIICISSDMAICGEI